MQRNRCLSRRNWKTISRLAVLIAGIALTHRQSVATQLRADTSRAFDQYIRAKEARSNADLAKKGNFLWIDSLPQSQRDQAYASLHQKQILVQIDSQCSSPNCTQVPEGLIHDWIGLVFVPAISLTQALATLQDYNRDAAYYPSEVVRSKLLAKSGDEFHVYLRLKQEQIITVVLDTEFDIHYTHLDRDRVYARSYSTRVAEVSAPTETKDVDTGERSEKDHGFLWRLDSYWRFYAADGGIYIQCEAVSLTRDVPAGLGWLIGSFIAKIPAASLRSTLAETRTALLRQSLSTKENSQ